MSIKKMTKEELETMSYNDIANMLLTEEKAQTTLDLFKQIVELLHLPTKTLETKIGDFYTSLTTDQRFILLENGKWDLKINHKVADLIQADDIDDDEVEESDYDDEVIEEEEEMFEDQDETGDDVSDEYKNLVIIDEEDLNQEE